MAILSILKESSIQKEEIENIIVSTIDNNQEEENDIILLSSLRSNKENNIGFLKDFIKVWVAFSRSILGFCIIGNIDCIITGVNK